MNVFLNFAECHIGGKIRYVVHAIAIYAMLPTLTMHGCLPLVYQAHARVSVKLASFPHDFVNFKSLHSYNNSS